MMDVVIVGDAILPGSRILLFLRPLLHSLDRHAIHEDEGLLSLVLESFLSNHLLTLHTISGLNLGPFVHECLEFRPESSSTAGQERKRDHDRFKEVAEKRGGGVCMLIL